MDAPPPDLSEPEVDPVDGARVRRAVVLIAIAAVVMAGVGLGYLHPSFGSTAQPAPNVPSAAAPVANYALSALDFVNPTTGWAVVTFDDGDYLVIGTTNAGRAWAPQLTGPTNGHSAYLKFFDGRDGVFALTGARPLVYHTADGGRTWQAHAAVTAQSAVLAYSLADAADGWMLVQVDPHSPGDAHLYRTADAGTTWKDLGRPVSLPDQAYSVAFSTGGVGWLATLSSGPHAYRSGDYGATWTKVDVPTPKGWPAVAQYLVAAQPLGSAVVASIVAVAPASGRSGVGATILDYPPLKVRAFDGGVPVTYFYGVATDTMSWQVTGLRATEVLQVQAPNQSQFFSDDDGTSWTRVNLPTAQGTIGVLDAWNWWWVGHGAWSMTADAGQTWSAQRHLVMPPALEGSLQVLDPKHAVYATMIASRPAIVFSSDGGSTWNTVDLPPMSRGL